MQHSGTAAGVPSRGNNRSSSISTSSGHLITKKNMGSSNESADDKVKQKILSRIELKCLEMKELMLSQSNVTSDYVELRVRLFRHMLLKKEGLCAKDEMHSTAVNMDTGCVMTSKKPEHTQSSMDVAEVASGKKTKRSQRLVEHRTESENDKCNDTSRPCHDETSRSRTSKQVCKSRSRSSSSGASGTGHKRSTRSKESVNSHKSKSSSHNSGAGCQTASGKHARRRHRKRKAKRRNKEKSRSQSSQAMHRSRSSRDRSRSPFIPSGCRQRSSSSGHCSRRSYCSGSFSSSRSRTPSVRRRRGSPSHLDRRRITSARKRPVPYYRPSPSPTSSLSWSSLSPGFRFSRSPIPRRKQRLRDGSPMHVP